MTGKKIKTLIGSAEEISFFDLEESVHARIDSGARTSSIWGKAHVNREGVLVVSFFGKSKTHKFAEYGRQVVATSTGQTEARYTIKLRVRLRGRRVKATFTIANRSSQVYPVLIGRNILRGRFIIDVDLGDVLVDAERKRIDDLQKQLKDKDIL